MNILELSLNGGTFLILALLGVTVGSFLNVVIYRLPIMIKRQAHDITRASSPAMNLWTPSSFCYHCQKPLTLWQKLPLIGFIFSPLGRMTVCCRKKIPWHYLLVEVLSGILSSVLGWRFGVSLQLCFALILIWSLIVLVFIDIETFLLPDQITLSLLWLGLLVNTFSIFVPFIQALYGALFGYLSFYIIGKLVLTIRKIEGIGRGDYKLFALLGAWLGWKALFPILFASSLLGSVFGLLLYSLKKNINLKSELPFAPFLVLGSLIVLIGNKKLSILFYSLILFISD